MEDDLDRLLADAHELLNATYQELDSLNSSLNREGASSRNTQTPERPLPAARPNRSPVYDLDVEVERINRLCDRAEENIRSAVDRRPNVETDTVPPEPNEVIDLSETQNSDTSGVEREDHEDEVVIIGNVPLPVVDLCSPYNPSQHRYRRWRRQPYSAEILYHRPLFPTSPEKDKNLNESDEGTQATSYPCPICLDSCLKKEPTTTSCGHVFCNKCIRQALKQVKSCPICKKKINERNLTRLYL